LLRRVNTYVMLTYTRCEAIDGKKVEVTYIGELQNGGIEMSTFREVGGDKNPYPIEEVPDYVLNQWVDRLENMKNKLENNV